MVPAPAVSLLAVFVRRFQIVVVADFVVALAAAGGVQHGDVVTDFGTGVEQITSISQQACHGPQAFGDVGVVFWRQHFLRHFLSPWWLFGAVLSAPQHAVAAAG